ncbi:MAG: pyridoxamine 5'-phosphate oxidase family protein [Saprospiraceae bacterium]|nr:pyridoxamine 5'-phosphate oxidase family protein [Saprospiraceae bacterium]
MSQIYHSDHRKLQKHFNTERLADRLEELIVNDRLSDEQCRFIEQQNMFFIGTVNENGQPTVSYKGGHKGFVKVLDNQTIAFPGYDGNGMYLTTGNILSTQEVGLLFINFEKPKRLRLHGIAGFYLDDMLLSEYKDAKYIVRIKISNVFDNCPRYIHKMQTVETSEYVPREGFESPIPGWKLRADIKDTLPPE